MRPPAAEVRCVLIMKTSSVIVPRIARVRDGSLLSDIFCGLRYLEMFAAKYIQSRCRNLREMKDVFEELKVLSRKRKSCTAQINKDILDTIFTSTSTFLVTF